jgi:hypothetical protein
MQVPAINTPATPGQILGALLAGGAPPSGARILLAQSAFETGGWKGGFWGNNLGNITTSGVGVDFQTLPGDLTHKYKVYATLADGAADYVAFLARRGLTDIAATGDLTAYVARLKAVGYAEVLATPAGVAQYQNGMATWMTRLQNVQPEGAPLLLAGIAFGSPWAYFAAGGLLAGAFGLARAIHRGDILF